jgi:hypothetical protein
MSADIFAPYLLSQQYKVKNTKLEKRYCVTSLISTHNLHISIREMSDFSAVHDMLYTVKFYLILKGEW